MIKPRRFYVTREPEEVFVDFGLNRLRETDASGRPWTLHLYRWGVRLHRNRDGVNP